MKLRDELIHALLVQPPHERPNMRRAIKIGDAIAVALLVGSMAALGAAVGLEWAWQR